MTTYYLEMHSLAELKEVAKPDNFEIAEAEIKDFRVNRFLYQWVGEPWSWQDKLALTKADWQHYAESDALRTWLASYRGSLAGYYELQQQDAGEVELIYFGLAPKFIGKGLGGYLLMHAIQSAWHWPGTQRVWVHTCTLDHRNALSNYQARGFTLYKTEQV